MGGSGAFSQKFAKRKDWKLNEGLLDAICYAVPSGSSINDLGAGIGKYVTELNHRGYRASGYDGTPGISELSGGVVEELDLARYGIPPGELPSADWTICIEVGEHIPPEQEHAFLTNLAASASDGIILSWGTLHQRGRNHINCHLPEYIAARMREFMCPLHEELTYRCRKLAGKGFEHKLLVFSDV